ncbi:MAG: MATE family efflux transporter [Acidobacteria bacterium]|nr:MAG: MATE family efflux transporter [Acidobacteriota bacterium]
MVRLAAPLVLSEIGWMAMGVVDTMAVGRVSAEAIGAVSLGAMIFYAVGVFASGLLLGLDTLVAQSFGAGDLDDCRHSLINGIWLAVFLIPLVMAAVWATIPLLAVLGINPAVLRETRPYIKALNWSAPSLLLFFALRRYLQAVNIVRPIMMTLLTANLVNLAGNWVLVYGNLGAPRLGAEGSGWATCISRVYMMAVLGIVILSHDRGLIGSSWRPDFRRIRRLLELGFPAALQIGLETGVFATVTVLIGKLNAAALAAHQIALATVSMTYMMPLGISSAAAVRVGHALGRDDPDGAARSGWTALALGGLVMSSAALALLVIPHGIARAFTPEPEIIAAGVVLLRVAAFFQLFDGFQVVATGALRGAGDTRTPMFCHFAGYWIIGLPLGAMLCFGRRLGAAGLWMGLSAGLILIGVVLVGFWQRAARGFRRSSACVSPKGGAAEAER